MPISKFTYLNNSLQADQAFIDSFLSMQKIYVLNQSDYINPETDLMKTITKIKSISE
jgi:hypothetical protein